MSTINPSSAARIIDDGAPLLPDKQEEAASCLIKCYHFLVGGAAIAGVTVSSVYLRSVFTDFTTKCEGVLNTFSPALIKCRSEFTSDILSFEVILIISSIAFGYLLQKSWEIKTKPSAMLPDQNEISGTITRSSFLTRQISNLQHFIANAQREYSYEATLALGYLFNGLWFIPQDQKSWYQYYGCQAASMSLAGAVFGMYLRIQQHAVQVFFSKKTDYPSINNCKLLATGLFGASLFSSTYLFSSSISEESVETIRGIALMIFARPIGSALSRYCEKQKKENPETILEKAHNGFTTFLYTRAPLLLLGYILYLRNQGLGNIEYATRLGGTVLIGFAGGIKDAYFIPFDYSAPRKLNLREISHCDSTKAKITKWVKNYWKGAVVLTAATILAGGNYLPCESIKMYVCPFSFELSGNYVNLDGTGLALSLYAGFVGFYCRKILKKMAGVPFREDKPLNPKLISRYTEKTGLGLLEFMDKYQYDMVSLIPYTIFRSGEYISAYKAFASYDPLAVLFLLGFSMGVFKEQIKTKTGMQISPGFVNVGIMVNPV